MIMAQKTLLLSPKEIELKIQRLSNEVAEKYYDTKEIFMFGIEGQGVKLAGRIQKEYTTLTGKTARLFTLRINKQHPIGSVNIDKEVAEKIKTGHVLLIDDVLNSGKTLFYAMQAFVQVPLSSLRVLVLVNRNHLDYPVYPEFVGMTLSTTYQNYIEADLKNKSESQVYLLNK
ncbi:MAG: phosphoribosyltransferase domain-containing protein [Bacteroidia bacterium]